MLFSIATVSLNNLEGLRETYKSVICQANSDWEWVVIDGGSRDGTVAWLQELQEPRLKWISEPDNGLYDGMNKAIRASHGDYLIFMNSGDCFYNADVLQDVAILCSQSDSPIDFVYGDAVELDAQGHEFYKPSHSHTRAWYGMFTHHQAMFYQTTRAKRLNYRGDVYKIAADYAFTIEFLSVAQKVKYLPKPICFFEKGGLSERWAKQGREEVRRVQRDILKLPGYRVRVVTITHGAMHFLKNRTPRLYKLLRRSR